MIADLEQDRGVAGQVEDRPDEQEGQHRSEHEHVAMGEVDELDDAVDEGVAEGHEGEDQAVGQADDLGLEERFRAEDEDADDLEDRGTRGSLEQRCSMPRSVNASRWRRGARTGMHARAGRDGPPRPARAVATERYSLTVRISWKAGGQLVSTL